ncbi:2'-5' RNA ligase family protein [Micromonospora sp. NPDC049301]|uniref:2'-5' RNA ligase family protein n=1 Tax=Micromonospora sp. NPDC049301 TaxID=3155723 RepID=UPI003415EEAD
MSFADLAPGQHADRVRDHWWWRPGWRVGRRFYAFHVTFQDQPDLYRLANAYRSALSAAPSVTLIPDQWLHLTMQGIGFTDETSDQTLGGILEEAGKQLGQLPAVDVELREIVVADEAVVMPATPAEAVQQLRTATRTGIGRVVGEDQVPEDPSRYRPHVSFAYLTADGPAEPYIRAVEAIEPGPATVRISHVDLIEMHRDRLMYEWSLVARLNLKGRS